MEKLINFAHGNNDYAIPYEGTGKPVVKIGIGFSRETRTVSEWKINDWKAIPR